MKGPTRRGIALTTALLLATLSSAAETEGESQSKVLPVLPELKIGAKTEGSAEFAASASIVWGAFSDADLIFSPSLKFQTKDGAATLLNVDRKDGPPDPLRWRAGLGISYVSFAMSPRIADPLKKKFAREGFDKCLPGCGSGWKPKDESFKAFCAEAAKVQETLRRPASELAETPLCEVGRAKAKVSYEADVAKAREQAFRECAAPCRPDTVAEAGFCKTFALVSGWPEPAQHVPPSMLCESGAAHLTSAEAEARKVAFGVGVVACQQQCRGNEDDGYCKAAHTSRLPDNLSSADLCQKGLDHYNQATEHMGRARVSPLMISAGFVAGRDGFEYRTETGDPERLAKDSENKTSGDVGASLVALLGERQTLEASAFYSAAANAASTTIQWCTPRGRVPRGSDPFDPDNPNTFDPASSCSKATLGPPTLSKTFSADIQYGLVNRSGEGWRVAMGPWLELSADDWDVESFGWRIPIYVDLVNLPKEYGSYRGVFRVVPAIDSVKDSDGTRFARFSVAFELLAQRTLFGSVLDRF